VTKKNSVIAKLENAVRNYYHRMKALPGSTNGIAKGVALGIAFDFLPIPILSIPLSYFFARIFRFNPVATVGTVIFFKLAVPFFYSLDFLTGRLLFGNVPNMEINIESSNSIITNSLGKIMEHGYPFLFGSMVNAAIAYVIVYYVLIKILNVNKKKGV